MSLDLSDAAWDALLDELVPPVAEILDVPGWNPQPKQLAAQDLADAPDVFEMLYGGAAGGGKSFWIRNDAVRFCLRHPGAHVGLVRRTMPMLKQTHLGPLRDICRDLAEHNRTESTWTFPNGSVLRFISLQHEGDEQNYKSVEFDRLYFDEVTELAESQYTYMLSRLRSQQGHPVTAICVSNPEGVGYAWVKRRFVKPKTGDLADGQTQPTAMEPWRPPLPTSTPENPRFGRARVFVPATVYDNPALLAANPDYITQLEALPDPRKRKALLEGDWDAMDQVPGALFKLSTIEEHRVASCPQLARVCVAVDPAGSDSDSADDTGIIVTGKKAGPRPEFFVLADRSVHLDADGWARAAIKAYIDYDADFILVEKNFGGDMTRKALVDTAKEMRREGQIDHIPTIKPEGAKVGKRLRADPVAVLYTSGQVHHIGELPELEEQMTTWIPDSGMDSPDRMDALVWSVIALNKVAAAGAPLRDMY